MAIDKKLQIFDDEGNPVDYDILASDVKFNDGKDLPTKLAEMEEEIGEGGYTPPAGGIPKTDLAPSVQQTLDDVANKVDKVPDKGLSTNDYTTEDKTKLAGLPTNPVQSISVNGTAQQKDTNGNVNIQVQGGSQGPKGDTGNCQITGDGGNIVTLIVNDLITGGAGNILSAEMGRRLAMMSGTYAQAWARSKAIPFPFCFLWIETVEGVAVSKPIWHKGNSIFIDAIGAPVNIDAASVPNSPTITGATNGSTVSKNTQITITPDAGSALYYSIDGGTTYQVSDRAVSFALNLAGNVSIIAYCANNKGNSSNATLNVTVAGTAVPTMPTSGEVARGGSVTVSVQQGGELHYKVGSGEWQTANGLSVTIPVAGTGTTSIQAYNVQDGDTSDTVTGEYTMAALDAPTMAMSDTTEVENEFPATGGTVALSATSGTIYFTTDGTDPDDSSTQYSSPITVTSRTTIKAVAKDAYGYSAVETKTFTVKQQKIAVTTSAETTMSLGESGLTAIPLTEGLNEFTIDDINTIAGKSYTSFADHVFPSLSFGDNSKIVRFDGGGVRVCNINAAFGDTNAISQLVSCTGIVLSSNGNTSPDAGGAFKHTKTESNKLANVSISGTASGSMQNFMKTVQCPYPMTVNLSGLVGTISNAQQMFECCGGMSFIDISGISTGSGVNTASMFRRCYQLRTIKFKKLISSLSTNMFLDSSSVKVLVCVEPTPYTTNWISLIGSGLTDIYVPDESVEDYKAANEWSTYASIIKGISQYNQ